jgi:hypothetical protein
LNQLAVDVDRFRISRVELGETAATTDECFGEPGGSDVRIEEAAAGILHARDAPWIELAGLACFFETVCEPTAAHIADAVRDLCDVK